MGKESILRLVVLVICLSFQSIVSGQQQLKGRVLDDETGKGVPRASIYVDAQHVGTSCDSLGYFSLSLPQHGPQKLSISAIGYKEKICNTDGSEKLIEIRLSSDHTLIDAVEISHKKKYANRNPAVDIIHQVIKHKRKNRLENQPKLQFEQYDKLQFSLINPPEDQFKRLGSMRFFFENLDTVSLPGSKLLTIFMEEQLSDVYTRKSPQSYKKIIKSQQKTEFDKRYINNNNILAYMNYLIQEVEIYDESVFLINKLFLSPIADNAPTFYKYYISDTLINAEGRYVELAFEPRNKTDLLFSGLLHISLDNRYAVRFAELKIGPEANLNWVNGLSIGLTYQPTASQAMLLAKSDVRIKFGTAKNAAVYGRRLGVNRAYKLDGSFSDAVFQGAPTETLATASADTLIASRRPEALSKAEENTYHNVEALNNNKTFKTLIALGYLVAQGYHHVGPFEFGPLEYLYSKNNIEGNRIRIGGRTTGEFSERVFVETYLAMGSRDKELKYFVRAAVALNGKAVTTFPAHYLEATVQHDILDPGRHIGFLKGDSFFQSIRKNRPTKWLATDAYRLGHVLEFGNHISLHTAFTHQRRTTIGDLEFLNSDDLQTARPHVNTNDVELMLRWAPKERFYYRNLVRKNIIEKYPVFNLQYNRGISGFWDADYTYDALRASVSKRFFLNQLGFADATVAAGKIWGTLPYTLLEIPDIVKKEDRHVIDYSRMNSMEFVADQYVKFAFEHQLQGFILNKIPLIKKLKLRELWGVKMFYGSLQDANNPYLSKQVVHFDQDKDGHTLTNVLGKTPYWEGKVGLDNIFRVLRIEYIRRLNYTDLNNVDKDSYRLSVHLNF